MEHLKEIGDYYEALAPTYDQDRFGNSYGQFIDYQGVLFLPIHRFPVWLRQPVRWLDRLLCRSPWREYASYLVVKIQKV